MSNRSIVPWFHKSTVEEKLCRECCFGGGAYGKKARPMRERLNGVIIEFVANEEEKENLVNDNVRCECNILVGLLCTSLTGSNIFQQRKVIQ